MGLRALSGCREPAPLAPLPSPSALAVIKQAPTSPAFAALEPGPEVALSLPGPELLVPDQPWLRSLRSWAGALIAVSDPRDGIGGSYRVDPMDRPERAHAVPLVLPGTKRVIDVAMQGDTPVALVVTDDGLRLH